MQIILKRLCVALPSPVNQESRRHVEQGILPPQFYTGKTVKLPGVPSKNSYVRALLNCLS